MANIPMRRANLIDLIRAWKIPMSDCDWFALQAMTTWDRIGFVCGYKASKAAAGRKVLPITEVSITENLLYDFILRRDQAPGSMSRISLLQAEFEPKEGNDLDLVIRYPFGAVRIMLQAKLLNGKNKYRSIRHSNKRGQQIDLLIAAAKANGALPAYLFYNHKASFRQNETWCNYDHDQTQYGCTVASAERIREEFRPKGPWKIPTFEDLHEATSAPQLAVPWIRLFCCDMEDETALRTALGLKDKPTVKIPKLEIDNLKRPFTLDTATINGEKAETVMYRPIDAESKYNWELPKDPMKNRYYARFVLSVDLTQRFVRPLTQ